MPTHDHGNVLDLCFASSSVLEGDATAIVQRDLDVSSDHLHLFIKIPCQVRNKPNASRFRFATIHDETFLSLFHNNLAHLTLLTAKSSANLDKRADELSQILFSCYLGSAKQSLPHNKGQPWWNQSCREAKKIFKEKSRAGSVSKNYRKAFRKFISQAESQFFQKITDQAANPKDVFNIAKWHKSKGDFRTPPLIDPHSPDSPPAQNVEEKRDLLARNLLCNQSGAEDIPLSAPSVPRAALPFPELTYLKFHEPSSELVLLRLC